MGFKKNGWCIKRLNYHNVFLNLAVTLWLGSLLSVTKIISEFQIERMVCKPITLLRCTFTIPGPWLQFDLVYNEWLNSVRYQFFATSRSRRQSQSSHVSVGAHLSMVCMTGQKVTVERFLSAPWPGWRGSGGGFGWPPGTVGSSSSSSFFLSWCL